MSPNRSRFTVSFSRQTDANHVSKVPPKFGLIMGGFIAAAGLAIVFVSLGWLPSDPSSVHAPMWVVGLAGVVFLLPGLLMCYYALRNARDAGSAEERPAEKTWGGPSWFVAVIMVTSFAAIGLWIGFSEVPQQCTGGITGSETECRIAFGSGGVICAMLATWMWIRGLKEIFQPTE